MANPLSDALLLRHRDDDRVFLALPDGRSVTYADFVGLTSRLAHALVQRGVGIGDRILMQVRKSPEALALYGASLRVGALLTPVSTGYAATDLNGLVDDLQPALIICDRAFEAAMPSHATVLTLDADGSGSFMAAAAQLPGEFHDAERTDDDVAIVPLTSGTTNRPKGCMLTHGNLLSNARALAAAWRLTRSDVLLHVMPIHHTHGLLIATNAALAAGASMIMLPTFSAAEALRAMPHATVMMATPPIYMELLDCDGLDRDATAAMRLFVSGGAPLAPKVLADFECRTEHRILERHAMTEASVSASNPYDGERRTGTVGLPLPGVSIRVVDRDSGKPLTRGEVGIVEVKGPNVFRGYWRMPNRTADAFRPDGYFITGDVGRFDAEGYLEILGRGEDLIVSGGHKIDAREVELVIDDTPGVKESAVIGVRHPALMEALVSVVVTTEGARLSEGDVLAFAASRLPPTKQPGRVLFVDELPRNATGKVQKRLLREAYRNTFS